LIKNFRSKKIFYFVSACTTSLKLERPIVLIAGIMRVHCHACRELEGG